MPPGTDDASTGPIERPSVATLTAQLAEIERHLREAPPHSSGDRQQLEVRRLALQRTLAEARSHRSD